MYNNNKKCSLGKKKRKNIVFFLLIAFSWHFVLHYE